MSLINEALKKVEKDRQGPATPNHKAPPPPSTHQKPPTDEEEPQNNKLFFIIFATSSLLIALIVMVFIYFLKPQSNNQPQTQADSPIPSIANLKPIPATTPSPEPTIAQAPTPPTPPVSTPTPTPPAPQQTNDDLIKEFQSSPNTTSTPETAKAPKNDDLNQEMFESFVGVAQKLLGPKGNASDSPSTNTETAKSEAPEEKKDYSIKNANELLDQINQDAEKKTLSRQIAKKNPDDPITDFLNSLNITGVMFHNSQSKVLMNNQVYSINSIVNPNPRLILRQIQPHTLVFTDDSGRRYSKEF